MDYKLYYLLYHTITDDKPYETKELNAFNSTKRLIYGKYKKVDNFSILLFKTIILMKLLKSKQIYSFYKNS